ncbi:MAG: DUF3617 family protein [Chromatiales bacterium]|nr:DUF3617 family protein [Chromatiales bacterium]
MRPIFAALTLVILASPALAQEPGNLWEVTTSMEGGGMTMPGRTQQVCAPVNAEGPEAMASEDNRCQMTDVRRSPGRFSYKVQCPDGSGTGEMTYQGNDSYTQVTTMTMDGTTMKMSTKGKRIGSCDASKVKKQIAGMQAQAAAGMAQACGSTVEQLLPGQLAGLDCDPKYRKQLCDRFGTRDGYRLVASRQPMGEPIMDSGTLPEVAKYCGVQAEQVRERLCSDANRAEDLDFIGAQCPALAQPIAQSECAGRGFTTPPADKYRDFCSNYARGMMDGGAGDAAANHATPAAPDAKPSADDVLKEGAKRLKGLFGR